MIFGAAFLLSIVLIAYFFSPMIDDPQLSKIFYKL